MKPAPYPLRDLKASSICKRLLKAIFDDLDLGSNNSKNKFPVVQTALGDIAANPLHS